MPQKRKKNLLLHPTRLKIYKILCETPGQYFYKLMEEVGEIPKSTLLYHLEKLEDDGILKSEKIDGKRIYIPKTLRDKDVERAYMLLINENAKDIFLLILNHNFKKPKDDNINTTYVYQNMIAEKLNLHHDTVRYHTDKLQDAGLIKKIKKGRIVHFEVGELGEKIYEGSFQSYSEHFIRFIIKSLSDDCHFPEVKKVRNNILVIRIVCPGEDDIELSLDISGWALE